MKNKTGNYTVTEPEFCGSFKINEEIKILNKSEIPNQKIGWVCHEIGLDGAMLDGSHIDDLYQPEKCKATNLADQYKTYSSINIKKSELHGYMVMPVLEFLNGKPWDNMALNFIDTLRPSSVRVTTGYITLDTYTWRVTVYLEKDERTIRKIEQEVNVGLYGIRNGQDASLYARNIEIQKHQPTSIINVRAIKKLQINSKRQ